jgi:pyruvate-ferredoxin/flavodoxin oxidoreductase
LRGLQVRRPAVFILNAPCPREWGIAQDSAPEAARLALESRAVPNIVFDPDRGATFSECLDLEGNPSPEDRWSSRELVYVDEEGEEQRMTLPLTIADWALGEERFLAQFSEPVEGAELVPFHEYLDLDEAGRADAVPFIYTVDVERKLGKICVSSKLVELAEERLRYWAQLKELAGIEVSEHMREAVGEGVASKLERKLADLKSEYEAKIANLTSQYPVLIARKIAEGLLKASGNETVAQLLEKAESWKGPAFKAPAGFGFEVGSKPEAESPEPQEEAAAPAEAPAATEADEEEEVLSSEPWIETIRCTSCDECTTINNKMFAYNEDGLAYIKDPRAGTFRQLVEAAEKCAPSIIHPGEPLNPDEKGLEQLIKRAEPFN